eukprot:CAMPEP_0204367640 /NCGR_PEP_ID=MMETSP0469-20131031/43591_1 /ASSEMBLY_ACC=CAM_ASM_000384 /TAXON_ID=2969 /ORGANISM="Oxyrrhis marina" /LENGTH=447 /DNA_ID=CAMNT_0051357079 /DNA_START=86 /DNA_END=1426 /DNA_ORIENTATION=-
MADRGGQYMGSYGMDPSMNYMHNYGAPPVPQPGTQVRLSVRGASFQYQLTQDDLEKVFQRYGVVRKVDLEEERNSAVISFSDAGEASAAARDLDGKPLSGQNLDGRLSVKVIMPEAPAAPVHDPYGYQPQAMAPNVPDVMTHPGMVASQGQNDEGVRKYTCRFDIGIANDETFRVARRIIGTSGKNMKKIVKLTDAKLRLRGRGSGFLEGAQQKESPEPLQLCVSCKTKQGYETAVAHVEALLVEVYNEYAQFCAQNGLQVVHLQPSKREHALSFPSATSTSRRDRAHFAASGGGAQNPMMQHGAQAPPYGGNGYGPPGQMPYYPSGWGGPMMMPPPYGNGWPPNMPNMGGDGGVPNQKGGGGQARSRRQQDPTGAGNDHNHGAAIPGAPPPPEVEDLIDQRNEARRSGDFDRADAIREDLRTRGIALMDEPGGRGRGTEVTTWRYW